MSANFSRFPPPQNWRASIRQPAAHIKCYLYFPVPKTSPTSFWVTPCECLHHLFYGWIPWPCIPSYTNYRLCKGQLCASPFFPTTFSVPPLECHEHDASLVKRTVHQHSPKDWSHWMEFHFVCYRFYPPSPCYILHSSLGVVWEQQNKHY